MDTSILEEVGLSSAEAKVYLALLELGRTKSGAIVSKTKLQPSVVFLALHGLQDKGLLTHITTSKHKQYSAVSPTAILALLDHKRREFEKALPSLLAKKPATPEGAELFEGIAGLQTMFFTMIADAKPKEELLYFDAEEHGQTERAQLVYLPFHARTKEKRIQVKGISAISSKTKDVYKKFVELRFTSEHIPPDTTVFRDKLALVSWSETPKGVLITSSQLADQYRKVWQAVWERAK